MNVDTVSSPCSQNNLEIGRNFTPFHFLDLSRKCMRAVMPMPGTIYAALMSMNDVTGPQFARVVYIYVSYRTSNGFYLL